jgi:parallel beta-helix repeat protein
VSKSIDLVGERNSNTVITGGNFGTVVGIYASSATVTGFTITRCGSNANNAGVMILSSSCTICGNIIRKNNYFGVKSLGMDNTVYHNNFVENTYQAFDETSGSAWDAGYHCGGNYWSEYTGVDDNEDGIGDVPYPTGGNGSSVDRYPLIHPYGSIRNENTSEIFLSIKDAVCDDDTSNGNLITVANDIYPEHLFIRKSLIIQGEDRLGTIIDGHAKGTVVKICADNVVLQHLMIQNGGADEHYAGLNVSGHACLLSDLIIHDCYQGIILKAGAQDTIVSRNILSNNLWDGLCLIGGCSCNIVKENTFLDNYYAGVGGTGASNNYLYHNNFIVSRHGAYDDSNNIWDDGYPSGGNYWSDYQGADANGDGIGDTPYVIPGGVNKDYYPLMNQYAGPDFIPPAVRIVSPQNGLYLGNHRLFSRLLRHQTIIIGAATINVMAEDVQSGIAKVEFYVDGTTQPAAILTQAPYSWTWKASSLLKHRHTIIVVAWDNAGNANEDVIQVLKFL